MSVPQSAIPDVLGPGLRVVFCGINPGRVSAAAGAHFANPRNDFWRLLHAAGFTTRLYGPDEQWQVLDEGIGITNAAQRTTPGSGDLRRADFEGAAHRLQALAHELQPAWIGFVGKEAYRGAFGERPELGLQERRVGQTRLFVLPSTSPANAAVPWSERLRWFQELSRSSAPTLRPSVRAAILDEAGRIFLHRFLAPGERVWVTPGGAIEAGETDEEALRRELREEFGAEPVELGPWIWARRHVWAWRGAVYDTRERIALARIEDPGALRLTARELQLAGPERPEEHRWWSVDELEATTDRLSPRRLPELLRNLLDDGPPPDPIFVGA